MDFINYAKQTIEELRLPENHYLIVGSAIMEIHKLRKANDLDILVSDPVWGFLNQQFPVKFKNPSLSSKPIEYLQPNSKTEIYRTIPNINFNKSLENAEIHENLYFLSLQDLLQWKKMKNRSKDKADIVLIEKYLRK